MKNYNFDLSDVITQPNFVHSENRFTLTCDVTLKSDKENKVIFSGKIIGCSYIAGIKIKDQIITIENDSKKNNLEAKSFNPIDYKFILRSIFDNKTKKFLTFEEAKRVKHGSHYYPFDVIEKMERMIAADKTKAAIVKKTLSIPLAAQCEVLNITYKEILVNNTSNPEIQVVNHLRSKGHKAYFVENDLIFIIRELLEGSTIEKIRTLRFKDDILNDISIINDAIKLHGKKKWKSILLELDKLQHCSKTTWRKNGERNTNIWGTQHKGWPDLICKIDGRFVFIEVKVDDKFHDGQILTYLSTMNELIGIPWEVIKVRHS